MMIYSENSLYNNYYYISGLSTPLSTPRQHLRDFVNTPLTEIGDFVNTPLTGVDRGVDSLQPSIHRGLRPAQVHGYMFFEFSRLT